MTGTSVRRAVPRCLPLLTRHSEKRTKRSQIRRVVMHPLIPRAMSNSTVAEGHSAISS